MSLTNACGIQNLVRVLVVDDYEPWHRFVASALKTDPGLQIVGQVFDGLEGVLQAQKLQPDLILLDIGLPKLNGFQAAGRIRTASPGSRILVVSQTRTRAVVEAALAMGASGYVAKSDASRDLLPGVKAVLAGKRFLSASLRMHFVAG